MKLIVLLALILCITSCGQINKSKKETSETPEMVEVNLKVEGMTCEHCEMSIKNGVSEIAGVDSIRANHIDSTTYVKFDKNVTSIDKIALAIEERGYKVLR